MKYAQPVYNELSALTGNGRGIKLRPELAEINSTNGVCVYCECEFHDNKNLAKWIVENTTVIGEAIAKGILKTLGIEDKIVTQKTTYSGGFPTLPAKGYFKKGDTGAQVSKLQKFLNWYGNYGLDVDGDFGNNTLSAVKKFQKAEKLTADGLFGKKSLARAKIVKK